MSDTFSIEERSAIMRLVRSAGTRPELMVRNLVRRLGFRFTIDSPRLPGRPDLVFSKFKKVVFVHGCYWHQHSCEGSKRPKSNRAYWNRKLEGNIERDKKNIRLLRRHGWGVLIIWECQMRNLERLNARLDRFLRRNL